MNDTADAGASLEIPTLEGQLIGGRYLVGVALGWGAMGFVYEAIDRDLSRVVAIKLLPDAQCSDARAVERFLRQARAMARIEHRSAVRVYDRGLHDQRVPYVVMERLVGSDLRALLRAAGRLSLTRALPLAIELCEAVHAVHEQDIVHRDLKPGNVFLALADSAGPEQIKLLDFGVAKLGGEAALTGTQDVLGTLAYMAPEQLGHGGDANARSDVYALACIVYEMLTASVPFRAHSRAELLVAIAHDPPPPMAARGANVSSALEQLIARNLSKDERDRQASALAFANALRDVLTEGADTEVSGDGLKRASTRFRILERIGEGSFGVVYAAEDLRSGERVALKRLHVPLSEDLYRLKREFRTLIDVVHPNLVRRHELWLEHEEAFFTMELIVGSSLLAYLTQAPHRTRECLRQLATGLAELHTRGFVHRDLKPSNVIVATDERVVLLDFGLTVPTGTQSFVAGTPRYMAPEVAHGVIGPAADMFAIGVILQEVLSSTNAAPEPDELAWLCRALMAADPAQRPSAHGVLRWLAAAEGGEDPPRQVQDEASGDSTLFHGRSSQLQTVRDALSELGDGAPSVMLLRGESGMGKTALLARLQRELGGASVWLASSCRDSEIIPYPALDGALDALTQYLTGLPRASVAPLLPRHVRALAQLFPVLDRVEAISERRSWPQQVPRDPAQLRLQAYVALHGLLHRLCEQRPLVLVIDDAHWLDSDSAALLAHLLGSTDPPALLLLLAVRSDLEASPIYQALIEGLRVRTRTLSLEELPAEDSRDVARAWLQRARSDAPPVLVEQIVERSGGQPFLLCALAQHSARSDSDEPSLEAALSARWRASSPAAQHLLELTVVCERPLPLPLLLMAAGASDPALVRTLHSARLIRRVRGPFGEGIEPYHARVRAAVASVMPAEVRRAHHRALAAALSADSSSQPEALVEHLAGCGEQDRAAAVAVQAAQAAELQLAFDRAAALYSIAIAHVGADPQHRLARARALRHAGRSVDAAETLRDAAALAAPDDADRLLREAGELLLFAGELDNGLALLAPLIERAGLALAPDAASAIASGLEAFGQLASQGVQRTPRTTPPAAAELERLELSLLLANGLALIDMRGIPFAISALSSALALDQASLLHSACATFVTLTAGLFFNPLIAPALTLCRALTEELDTAYARALCYAAEGEAAHFSGHFLAAEAAFEQAERIFLEACIGTPRELAAVRNGAVLIEYAQKGDFASQLERTLGWQLDAKVRRDAFHENVLRVAHSIVWVAQDRPDKARAELVRAAHQWRGGAGAYEVGMLEFWDIVDRYEGHDDAHLRPLQGRRDILESPAASSPFLAGYVHLHRAWGSVRALASGRHTHGEREMAIDAIAGLRALGPEVWRAVADSFEANLGFLSGAREPALVQLHAAESRFRTLHMRCLAACAQMRHGELAGGQFGMRLVQEASAELRQLGVTQPERWSRAYFSLFDPARVVELTIV